MNPLVRRFIKTAFGFLVLGVLLGLTMLVQRELGGGWPPPYVVSAHKHAIFVGFVMFMILGVALWIFPRAQADDPRFRTGHIELVYWLLLTGTLARFTGELLRGYAGLSAMGGVIVAGGAAQVASFLLYIWTMWYRIRPAGRGRRQETERSGSDP